MSQTKSSRKAEAKSDHAPLPYYARLEIKDRARTIEPQAGTVCTDTDARSERGRRSLPSDGGKRRLKEVPFRERLTCTVTEGKWYTGFGRRKLKNLIAEGRLESVVIGHRRYLVVESLLRVISAGSGVHLPEPPQLVEGKFRATKDGV